MPHVLSFVLKVSFSNVDKKYSPSKFIDATFLLKIAFLLLAKSRLQSATTIGEAQLIIMLSAFNCRVNNV